MALPDHSGGPVSTGKGKEWDIAFVHTWIEISAASLVFNYLAGMTVLKREMQAGDQPALLAVIKADAYGHGASVCAPILAQVGVAWMGVNDVTEGQRTRQAMRGAGIEPEDQPSILLLGGGGTIEDPAAIISGNLVPVVWDRAQMTILARAAAKNSRIPVHLEIDSGMSRQGIALGKDFKQLLRWLAGEPRLELNGVLTHFASSDITHSPQTRSQREQFTEALQMVAEENLRPTWVHAGATSLIDSKAESETLIWLRDLAASVGARPMVRQGVGLYGYCMPIECSIFSRGDVTRLKNHLRPVMTWKTRVASLNTVKAGARVGYNGTYLTTRLTRLALLPVGFSDGLRRELSSSTSKAGGWVMIGGRRAPIMGRVSMSLTAVDVTGIETIAVGDEVVLLGEGITADDHARLAQTIVTEVLCGIRAQKRLVLEGQDKVI